MVVFYYFLSNVFYYFLSNVNCRHPAHFHLLGHKCFDPVGYQVILKCRPTRQSV